jgi:hypothetical protein
MSRRWLALSCLLLACTTKDEPAPTTQTAPKKNPSSWKEIETPVPVGKKVACAGLVAIDKIGDTLGKKLEIIDESARDPDATSVCRLMLAKVQPTKAPVVKGTPPAGDELATVTAYCWSAFTVPEVKKKCTDNGEETTTEIGMLTCIRKVPAGDNTRFIVTVLEPDTRCKLVVNPGPANTDLTLTKATALALVETIDKDSLKAK